MVTINKIGLLLLVSAVVVISVFPFYYAVLTSFKSGGELFRITYFPTSFSLKNYIDVFEHGQFGRNILNSVFVAFMTVSAGLLMGVTASFALSRISFRGRGLLLMCVLGVSMFPQMAVLPGLFEIIRAMGVYNTPWALIVSYTIFILPFTVWVLTSFMRDLPVEIEEAAIVDGASPWVIVTRIFLPLMWPAMVTTGILAFIAAWNEFLFALTFTTSGSTRTVPVAIGMIAASSEHETPWGQIMAASVVVTVPLVVLVVVFQRKIVAGLTAGGVKG
ncbi:MAG: carbohydrate ABC transporter permease [Paracoccaceae bacterium]|nr:carbohydrate ABC transporter permease [Paracoccaceae bacterium]